jgi:serine/threonine protein kinase
MRFPLLTCVGKALAKHGVRFLMNLAPGGDVIYDIANEVWEDYQRQGHHDALRGELEALAQASPTNAELRSAVDQAVEEAAGEQPDPVRDAMANYLTQVPATIRRSLRRPSDESGTTFASGETLRGADDLVRFLPSRLPRFKPGDRPLAGLDLELEELVGSGGFGEVWKARNPNMRNAPPVALKFCLDQSTIAVLRNEAGVLDRVMKQGRHAGIVPLLHTYLSADPPFLEYQYVGGGDLTGLIQEMHGRGRPKPDVANRLVLRLAEIVAFAHRATPPIVHGDLKPANLLVRRHADRKVALFITDFGIGGLAAALSVGQKQQRSRSRQDLLTDAVRGAYTPLYASPQQRARRPGEPADPRDDIHALAVIWFQLLTGDLGMTSIPTDWREQAKERGLSDPLIELLARCFSPKPEKRPDNAIVLVEQMRAALAATGSGNASSAGLPKAEDDLVVLQLAEEPASTPRRPEKTGIKTHRGPGIAGTRRRSTTASRRSQDALKTLQEEQPGDSPTWNVVGLVGGGAAALVLLTLLCAGAAWVLWPSSRVVENPPIVANAPPVNAPAPLAPQPAQGTPAKPTSKPAADKPAADLKKKEEADRLLAEQKEKEPQALAELKKQAEAEKVLAEQKEAEAEKKRLAEMQEKEAAQKKVMEAIEEAKLKLKAKAPKERQAGIAALAKLGAAAASADYDLCGLIVFDPQPQLRQKALQALEKVQPKLYSLVVTLSSTPENPSPGYMKAIKELPSFGRAGLPLIAGQLQGLDPRLAKYPEYFIFDILRAHAGTLSKVASDENGALQMLLGLPQSPLAEHLLSPGSKDTLGFQGKLRQDVGQRLGTLGKEKPETRKAIVPFLIGMLQSTNAEERVIGVNALGGFGRDAESALPVLNKLKLDPTALVCNAANEAIAKIEKGNK